MVRKDKQQKVKDLEELFKNASTLVLAEYRGLTVTQQTLLRKNLKNNPASSVNIFINNNIDQISKLVIWHQVLIQKK